VVRVEREFGPMDVVSIRDTAGREFARGKLRRTRATKEMRTEKTAARVLFTRENIVVLEAAG